MPAEDDGPRRDARPGRAHGRRRRARGTDGHEPVLPRSADESDVGWGDGPGGSGSDRDDERLRREVPPHWGGD